jgi:hypothetical protein
VVEEMMAAVPPSQVVATRSNIYNSNEEPIEDEKEGEGEGDEPAIPTEDVKANTNGDEQVGRRSQRSRKPNTRYASQWWEQHSYGGEDSDLDDDIYADPV